MADQLTNSMCLQNFWTARPLNQIKNLFITVLTFSALQYYSLMTSKNFPDFLTLPSKINYGRPFWGWKDVGHVLTPHFPLSVVYWSPDEIFKKHTFVQKARNCKVHTRSTDKWCLKWALLVLAVECQIFSIDIAGRSEICRT